MDSKDQFLKTIKEEYFRLTKDQIGEDKVDMISSAVANYYYDQYRQFGQQYPKSIKRYSTFQLKDLDHPETFEIIINLLKEKIGKDYEKFALPFLKMTVEELRGFEKRREEYHNR